MKKFIKVFFVVYIFTNILHGTAFAGVSIPELVQNGMPASFAPFAANVTASEGSWISRNQYNCLGAFQFCPGTFERYYSGTDQQFLADRRGQVTAYIKYARSEWNVAQSNGYSSLIGQNVCWNGRCAKITASSILKACQFGCGRGGKLDIYRKTGNCAAAVDGNNHSVCNYLITGAGFDISHITGNNEINADTASGTGSCLSRPIMSEAGERATSPFGVDRTSSAGASNGWHLGLDLANDKGRGDPIFAGIAGKVIKSSANDTNSVFVETSDKKMRFGYLHGDSRQVNNNDEVTPDTQLITMGDKGSQGAVHLHLYVSVSSELLKEMGDRAGVVWPLDNGNLFGNKRTNGLSGAALAQSAPKPYYMVNPETFLHHRVRFTQDVLNKPSYKAQGFNRPDGLTLEPTCGPSQEFLNGQRFVASDNGGSTSSGGMVDDGTAAATNRQVQANLATGGIRDGFVLYSISSMATSQIARNNEKSRLATASSLAGLILAGD